jgi:mono/diheme cytochrome c family protein
MREFLLPLGLLALAGPVAAQTADSLPPGVTAELVARGKAIFNGSGLCMACHGTNAKGVTGPDLTDQVLLHYDGSYEALVKVITEGIDEKQSQTGQVMPAKGGSAIGEEDVRAVAAYVWTLRKAH